MTGQAAAALAAGIAVMVMVWWPTSAGTPSALVMGSLLLAQRRSLRAGALLAAALVVLGFIAGLVLVGAMTGVAVMVLTGVGVWAIAVQIRSRRSLREADDLAQLTNGLANQALVAPTVVEAVRQAAPLITGRVGAAAQLMAAECETGGLVEAANRFSTTIRRPIAEMLVEKRLAAFGAALSGWTWPASWPTRPWRRPRPLATSTVMWLPSCPKSRSPW